MNTFTVPRQIILSFLGLLIITGVGIKPVLADKCEAKDQDSLKSCKDKKVKATGPRVDMFEVPESYATIDPSFDADTENDDTRQDYMSIGEVQVILHTKEEVQCPEKIKVKGDLSQIELQEGKEKAWLIKVDKFECL